MNSARIGWVATALLASAASGATDRQAATGVRVLRPEKAISRTLAPGQIHGYSLEPRPGDYVALRKRV